MFPHVLHLQNLFVLNQSVFEQDCLAKDQMCAWEVNHKELMIYIHNARNKKTKIRSFTFCADTSDLSIMF